MRTALFSIVIALGASSARADIAGPYDQLCDVEVQERDGSSCEVCAYSVMDRSEGRPDPCEALAARGLHLRCGKGATVRVSVYCDREADFLTVGRAHDEAPSEAPARDPSPRAPAAGGCAITPSSASPAWLFALAGLALRRRGPRR